MTFHGEMNFVSTKKYMISEINACLMLIEIFIFLNRKALNLCINNFFTSFQVF